MQNRWLKVKLPGNDRGASILFFAAAVTVILGIAALSVDFGIMVLEKSRLTASIDAAALAGAQELVANGSNTENIVRSYVAKNSGNLKQLDVSVSSSEKWVEVAGVKEVQSFFARIFDESSQDVSAAAKAKVENIKSLTGARPLAVIQQTFTYGKLYTLKEGAGDGSSGNYAAIALGGSGNSTYRDNLLNGYSGTIRVNDMIETETGNMSGTTETSINQLVHGCTHSPECTYQDYNKTCPRIIFIPIVNTLEVSGRKYVKVLGFGTFFLEGVTNHGGSADVTGRFITYHANGETSSEINDYGTYGIKLVK